MNIDTEKTNLLNKIAAAKRFYKFTRLIDCMYSIDSTHIDNDTLKLCNDYLEQCKKQLKHTDQEYDILSHVLLSLTKQKYILERDAHILNGYSLNNWWNTLYTQYTGSTSFQEVVRIVIE